MHPITVEKWLSGQGDRTLVYHTGFLALDRCGWSKQKRVPREPLNQVALLLYRASRERQVHLTQKRLGPGCFQYIATRRGRGRRG